MIPLLPLTATTIFFLPSSSPSLLAKSVIAEPSKEIVTSKSNGNQQVLNAYQARQSDVIVENVSGVVEAILPDDNEGSRHQRFIIRLAGGNTLLIVHNIDLAPRIDSLREGDRVLIKGEYEWNDRGGLIHWTHHDPRRVHEGGWIDHNGLRYQ
ncbi:MAG: DUF3465 domain-containing protein [Cyanobacteria bacterium P01_D01_bin.36]